MTEFDWGLETWIADLNDIPGVETLQSCNGKHQGSDQPGDAHIWFKGRFPDRLCQRIQALPDVDTTSILYGREPEFPVTEIRFTGPIPSVSSEQLLDLLSASPTCRHCKVLL